MTRADQKVNQGKYSALFRHFKLSPFDPSDEEHQVPVDFGAVNKLVNVAGVYRLVHV